MRKWALVVGLVACGDSGSARAPGGFDAAPRAVADAAPTVGEVAAATGIPAWRAVTDRARYLERRGDGGAVVGVLGAATDEYRWLVDETAGQGALAIRVALPGYARSLKDGERVEVAGAWVTDADQRWVWRARSVARVVAADAETPRVPHAPGLAIAAIDAPPEGAVPASAAKRGADIVFTVVGGPAKPGDGWQIADTAGAEPIAWLVLPGEAAAYGGQDMLADDERWQLVVGKQYTVRVARRPRRSAGLQLLNASGPPRMIR